MHEKQKSTNRSPGWTESTRSLCATIVTDAGVKPIGICSVIQTCQSSEMFVESSISVVFFYLGFPELWSIVYRRRANDCESTRKNEENYTRRKRSARWFGLDRFRLERKKRKSNTRKRPTAFPERSTTIEWSFRLSSRVDRCLEKHTNNLSNKFRGDENEKKPSASRKRNVFDRSTLKGRTWIWCGRASFS